MPNLVELDLQVRPRATAKGSTLFRTSVVFQWYRTKGTLLVRAAANKVDGKIARIVVYLGRQVMGTSALGNISLAGLHEEMGIVGPVGVADVAVWVFWKTFGPASWKRSQVFKLIVAVDSILIVVRIEPQGTWMDQGT